MEYHFNTDVAIRIGVEKAVIVHNIAHWMARNKANNRNFHDGRTWTFNSASAFQELFPFWNDKKIQRMLKSLEDDDGVLLSGNYNKSKYDRTKWYTISDESIAKLYSLDSPEVSNVFPESVEPIPDINTDINTDLNIIEHPAFTNQQESKKALKERLKDSFWQQLADKTTWSWPKEGAAVKQLVEKAMTKEEPEEFLRRLVLTFHTLREGGNDYWRKQPFLPSRLNSSGIYAGVVAEMTASSRKEEKASRQYDEIYLAVCEEPK